MLKHRKSCRRLGSLLFAFALGILLSLPQTTRAEEDTIHYDISACHEYLWTVNGETYTQSGTYYNLEIPGSSIANSSSTCTVHVLHLQINDDIVSSATATQCDSYSWRGRTLTVSDIYYDTTAATNGCDSIFRLNLTINPSVSKVETDTVCRGAMYYGYGLSINTNDQYGNFTYSTHTKTLGTRCDSSFTFTLVINQPTAYTQNITSCNPYTWNVESLSGELSQLGQFEADTTLQTVITNAKGCDSTITLRFRRLPSHSATLVDTACDSYLWPENQVTYTSSTLDTLFYTNRFGCDSISILDLTLYLSQLHVDSVTSCESYSWHNHNLTTGGGFFFDTINSHGCLLRDSLYLDIVHHTSGNEAITACDRVLWYGTILYLPGEYSHTLHNGNSVGCDSTINLTLNILPSSYTTRALVACDSIRWGGRTLDTSGSYTDTLANQYGCDSVVRLNLTLHYSVSRDSLLRTCDSLRWMGRNYTQSCTLGRQHFTTSHQCDSVVNLALEVFHSSYSHETIIQCDRFVWKGDTLTLSGDYTYDSINADNCPHVDILHLMIYHRDTVIVHDSSLGYYTWGDGYYSYSDTSYCLTGTATDGCDSVTKTLLHIYYPEGFVVPEIVRYGQVLMVNHHPGHSGSYVNYSAYRWFCDDVEVEGETLDIFTYPQLSKRYYVMVPMDDAQTIWLASNTLRFSGINDIEPTALVLSPNPVAQGGVVRVSTDQDAEEMTLNIFDTRGVAVASLTLEDNTSFFHATLASGAYMVQLKKGKEVIATRKLIVK